MKKKMGFGLLLVSLVVGSICLYFSLCTGSILIINHSGKDRVVHFYCPNGKVMEVPVSRDGTHRFTVMLNPGEGIFKATLSPDREPMGLDYISAMLLGDYCLILSESGTMRWFRIDREDRSFSAW